MKDDIIKVVYVIHNSTIKLTKIGISTDVVERTSALEAACGCPLSIFYITLPLTNARSIEAIAHKHFAKKRAIGEWFHIHPQEAKSYLLSISELLEVEEGVLKYMSGTHQSEIAREYRVSKAYISKMYKKWGVDKGGVTIPNRGNKAIGKPISNSYIRIKKNIYQNNKYIPSKSI